MDLYMCTRTELLVFAVRSSPDDYMQPQVIMTSDRLGDFFQVITCKATTSFAMKLEAYCLMGLEGAYHISSIHPSILIIDRGCTELPSRNDWPEAQSKHADCGQTTYVMPSSPQHRDWPNGQANVRTPIISHACTISTLTRTSPSDSASSFTAGHSPLSRHRVTSTPMWSWSSSSTHLKRVSWDLSSSPRSNSGHG